MTTPTPAPAPTAAPRKARTFAVNVEHDGTIKTRLVRAVSKPAAFDHVARSLIGAVWVPDADEAHELGKAGVEIEQAAVGEGGPT
jgi:hypothetical protein